MIFPKHEFCEPKDFENIGQVIWSTIAQCRENKQKLFIRHEASRIGITWSDFLVQVVIRVQYFQLFVVFNNRLHQAI
jgi:hypothetical protein